MTYFCYLFEAKSIQSYLFQSNKLKDVISASERLDRLIDSEQDSVLALVLTQADLASDLLVKNALTAPNTIHFLRCKGGAFYAWCDQESPLLTLRSLWTLTVSQLFPGMVYTDALTQGNTLPAALDAGMETLGAARNTPSIQFPMASTVVARYARTGKGAVPLSTRARWESANDDGEVDLDTEHHRQAYSALALKHASPLQDRFTPVDLPYDIHYPLDFDDVNFAALSQSLTKDQADAVKDIALIHVDGNGLGILLRNLKDVLQDKSVEEYCSTFRVFSDVLNEATVDAARIATREVYEQVLQEQAINENAGHKGNEEGERQAITLPMRPIVLGGDDITLFCRADLALGYAQTFCREFKAVSEKKLQDIHRTYLKQQGFLPYLTASGGVLFHKHNHPFTQANHLVEKLCKAAKGITKAVYGTDSPKVGPAALAFHRITQATQTEFNALLEQYQCHELAKGERIYMGRSRFFVPDETVTQQGFDELDQLLKCANYRDTENTPWLSRFRQMATALSQSDLTEAQRIFDRGMALMDREKDSKAKLALETALRAFIPDNAISPSPWYWYEKPAASEEMNASEPVRTYRTMLSDILLYAHYQPVFMPSSAERNQAENAK